MKAEETTVRVPVGVFDGRVLWGALVLLLALGWSAVGAGDPNDPNQAWKKWDIPVKDPNNPGELIEAKWQAVVSVLRAERLSQQARQRIIGKIVSPVFDFALMAKLAMGRTHWPRLNTEQQKRLVELFTRRLKTTYQEKTALYSGETATIKKPVAKGKVVSVPMELVSKDKKVSIVYKLRKLGKQWKIYDVEIQGVSIVLTYRSQFDDILRKGTVEELLSRLEKGPAKRAGTDRTGSGP